MKLFVIPVNLSFYYPIPFKYLSNQKMCPKEELVRILFLVPRNPYIVPPKKLAVLLGLTSVTTSTTTDLGLSRLIHLFLDIFSA